MNLQPLLKTRNVEPKLFFLILIPDSEFPGTNKHFTYWGVHYTLDEAKMAALLSVGAGIIEGSTFSTKKGWIFFIETVISGSSIEKLFKDAKLNEIEIEKMTKNQLINEIITNKDKKLFSTSLSKLNETEITYIKERL